MTVSDLDRAEQARVVESLRTLPPPAEDARTRLEQGRRWLAGEAVPGGRWVDLAGVRARLLQPRPPSAVLLNFHGGGWCIGSATSGEAELWVADACKLAVLSVGYRLAPEHPFPAGPDDCLAAARWLLREGRARFGTSLFLMRGCSAGAHLAALTLARLGLDAGGFAGALLYYGCYDLAGTPSRVGRDRRSHPDLAPETLEEFTRWFVPAGDLRKPEVSPLYADLSAIPRTLMLVGTHDVLLDDSLFLAARLAAAGRTAELVLYPDAPHGFDGYSSQMASDARRRAARFLSDG
ncbi:MAG: alpha/beta hydrolase fold domain-containing protein [Candidatus Eremiobacterota bacterium]